jgi:hypothetical protein
VSRSEEMRDEQSRTEMLLTCTQSSAAVPSPIIVPPPPFTAGLLGLSRRG